MRRLRVVGWLGIAAAGAIACSDDTGPTEDELTGSWLATKVELVSVENPSVKVDLVALGGTVRLVLAESNTYTMTLSYPGLAGEVITGTWSASEDVLTLNDQDGNFQFDMSLSGDTLTLAGADAEYDFDDDDVDDPAKLNITLVRD